MAALITFSILITLPGLVWVSTKIADIHYKTYKGNDPLYLIYGMVAVIIWISLVTQIFSYFN